MTWGSFWSGGFSFFMALWKKMWISLFSLAVVRSLLSKFWALSSIFFLENVNATAGSLSFFLSMSITDIQIFLSWNVDIKHSRAWIKLDLNINIIKINIILRASCLLMKLTNGCFLSHQSCLSIILKVCNDHNYFLFIDHYLIGVTYPCSFGSIPLRWLAFFFLCLQCLIVSLKIYIANRLVNGRYILNKYM